MSDVSIASPPEGVCPLCQAVMEVRYVGIVAEETGERFDVTTCPRCGLGRTRPTPADLGPYYAASYYGDRHGATARFCIRRRLGLVRRWLGPASGRLLLDFGCGDGGFALAARAEGWGCWGLERDRDGPAPPGLPVVADLAELEGLPPFAGVTFWHVLEHLVDPVATLSRLKSHLRPGGVVLAAVPNLASWQARVSMAAWLHLDIPRHLWHFGPASLGRVFEAAGFRVEGTAYGEFEYDVIGWSQGLLNRCLGGRNEFFRAMSGRPGSRGLRAAVQVPVGLALSALMTVPAWVESRAGRGGTLIVAARLAPE